MIFFLCSKDCSQQWKSRGENAARCRISRYLLNVPQIFAIGLVWSTPFASFDKISTLLKSIRLEINLNNIYTYADKWSYKFWGMICYYGAHYCCYFYKHSIKRWVMFDDANVKEVRLNLMKSDVVLICKKEIDRLNEFQKVGATWQEVKQLCRRAHYQPSLLFYEKYDPAQDSTYYQVTENDYNEIIQSPTDESSITSMSVDYEFSNDDYIHSSGINEQDFSHVFSKENFLPSVNHQTDNELHRNQNNVIETKEQREFPHSFQQQQQQQANTTTFSNVKKRSSHHSISHSFDHPSKSRKVASDGNPHASQSPEQNSLPHTSTLNHNTPPNYSALVGTSPQLHSSLRHPNNGTEDKKYHSTPLTIVPTTPFNYSSTPSAPPEDPNVTNILSLSETRTKPNTTPRCFLPLWLYPLVNED
jgi:hypothetical protein